MTELIGRDVTKTFGGLTAVDHVDIEVGDGDIVGLIGSNGAGKSTLFNCITGALQVDEGTIEFNGTDITGTKENVIAQRGIVRVFQEVRVYEGMTARENLLASVDHGSESTFDLFRPYPDAVTERADELLDRVGIPSEGDTLAADLNYGHRKLLELAMALMTDAELLLLDEPAAGLNPTTRTELRTLLGEINEEKTLLVVEHNMDFVMNICDRIYVLNNGELLAEGQPEAIQNDERVQQAYLGGGDE
ncbi:ABC transporter ATP-binding protein [Haladaptatus sp. AB618]|uniref:ABC transporter ATP-binding protein n=1 Tax=Haladaptatus sp. AB618 TaxID=2934173 RepID=UPI00209C0531|nr:ABC transporter ATP-binding protein [Haladaptatus sp. AB618]MCO8256830.1 ABC transporter ATP-binding protein [Haladaptatus sp. AB618]